MIMKNQYEPPCCHEWELCLENTPLMSSVVGRLNESTHEDMNEDFI